MINKKRLVNTFLELVAIDSPSGEETAFAEDVTKRLKELHGKVSFDSYGNLFATFEGKGEPFIFSTHLDTVEPGRNIKPVINGDTISSQGDTILGGDPKAGIAIILETITSLKETEQEHVPIEVILTREEELGLVGAINLDYKKIMGKHALILDGENDVNNVDLSAPGYIMVNITIKGKSAHAGIEPEKGISAIKIASEFITKIPLGRIDFETTANIGIISGGSARNAIPETVTLQGEIRSRKTKKMERVAKKVQRVFAKTIEKYAAENHTIQISNQFYPYELAPEQKLITKVVDVFKKLKMTPTLHHAGGATDANVFNLHGIEAVVLGLGDFEAHTTREYVLISQMVQATEICKNLVRKTNEQ
jgi:tripeptide aminopeptidase